MRSRPFFGLHLISEKNASTFGEDLFFLFWSSLDIGKSNFDFRQRPFPVFLVFIQFRRRKYIISTKVFVKLDKAAKASAHAKFYNLSTDCNDLESSLNQLFAGFSFINASSVNDVFWKFMKMLIQITNKHAPVNQLSRRQMKLQQKP